ncbi:MAG: divalent-cation tolerance protein CutA [Deltaproteobacteria bacterium]|nr:divalent-cation tolerance protein CutA [Deltaproteobacteria bacterium]
MPKHMTVFMTAPNEEEGAAIAKKLVEESLCACVNIIPKVRSVYRWEGKVFDESEVMMVAKTASSLAPMLVKRVKELHSYDVPEVICIPIATGSGDYLDWIDASVDGGAAGERDREI